ncbi:MAG: hypothetical protein NUV54_01885 [Candidatus Taylorbacteria bacterium]|nr:hypothetical protein [Candidatus Taylorbacteria bacterium]
MFGFNSEEMRVFRKLSTPEKIQNFLETIPINFETEGETMLSPRSVLREKRAHCFEGALFAAAAFWVHGEKPLVLVLRTTDEDEDHAIALFNKFGCWGAVTKTNHAVLRYREPIYKTFRELVISYFHEYFVESGKKTLREYTQPLDLSAKRFEGWTISESKTRCVDGALNQGRFFPLLNKKQIRLLRPADPIEIKAGKLVEWKG